MLHVFDKNLEYIGIMTSYKTLVWQESYQEIGKMIISAADEPNNIRFLKHGNILYQKGQDVAMRVSNVIYDTKAELITANGFTAMEILAQRVAPDPINVTNAEQGMYAAVSQNLRGLPDIELDTAKGYTETFETQILGNIPDELQRVATETELGYKMIFDPDRRKHIFTVYRGVDRVWDNPEDNDPVVFSKEFKNLENLTITDDDSLFANVAYVIAEDQGFKRVLIVGAADGLERHEILVEARIRLERWTEYIIIGEERIPIVHVESIYSNRVTQEMTAAGLDELNKRLRVQTFKAEVNPKDFRKKYDLGDIVTCKSSRYGLTIEARIMSFKEVTENNITKLTLTLGYPEYDIIKEMKLHAR